MEKPNTPIEQTSLINEIPNYDLILNTVKQEDKPFNEYDNISFEHITSFEKNKILIKIYNDLIWGAEISIPKFSQLEDIFIIIEYLFRRPFFNGYIYNNNEENIIDFHIISRIREIYKFLSGVILDILIVKNDDNEKNKINNIINNEDNETKNKQEKEKDKDKENIKKLCDILQINDEFFKYFCITIKKN